ncbi:MAG: type II toxin-antitoxin system VapC family toxin [Saprospiraceae bacterium]
MKYLLDTNIIIHYLRRSPLAARIESTFQPLFSQNSPIISVVTEGELRSFALQNNWGQQRLESGIKFLHQFLIADINVKSIIERYAEIDAFSQGRHPALPLQISARNMGKNDLWIAATASVLDATLLTTDKDFDHLSGHFLKVESLN